MGGLQAASLGCPCSPRSLTRSAFVGKVEFGQAFSLASPGSSSAGDSRWPPLCCGKGNSLFIWFLLSSHPMEVRGKRVSEKCVLEPSGFRAGQVCSFHRAYPKVFLAPGISLLPC